MTQAPSLKEALLIRAQAFVDRKYVMRADARQKEMGLAYVEAERQDLAREIARFCTNELEAALSTLQPSGERREAIAQALSEKWPGDYMQGDDECEREPNALAYETADAAILASVLVKDEAGWRDINTAPQDGTEILLFTHHEADEYLDESFDAVQIGWWDDGNHAPGSAFHRDAGWHQQKIGSATHWMPLPTPPIRSARDGGEG